MIKLNILLQRILLSFLKKYLKSTDMPANTINDKLKFVKDSNMIANLLNGYKNDYKIDDVFIEKIKDDEVIDKPYKSFYRVSLKSGVKSLIDLNYYFEHVGALYYLVSFLDFNSNYIIDREYNISGKPIKKKDIAEKLAMSNEKVSRLLTSIEHYIKIDHNNKDLKGFYVNPKLAYRAITNQRIKIESSYHSSRYSDASIRINDSLFDLEIFKTLNQEYKSNGMNRLGVLMYLTLQMDKSNVLLLTSATEITDIIIELCCKFKVLSNEKHKVYLQELIEEKLITISTTSKSIIVNPMFAIYTKSDIKLFKKDLNNNPYYNIHTI